MLLTDLALKIIVFMILGNCLHRMPVTAAGGDPSVLPHVHVLLPALIFGKAQVPNQAEMLETHRGFV